MSRFVTYDSEAVSLVACGVSVTDGRKEGSDFVSVEPAGPAFASRRGACGHVVRYATHEKRRKVLVKLLASSKHNQVFSALHAADCNAPNGAGVGPFLLKDNSGATIIGAAFCWITGAPTVTKGEEVGDVEWEFEMVAEPETVIIGGN